MKSLILAVIGGVVITLLTGLIGHSPSCTRVVCLAGEVYDGYPLAWVQMLVGASWFVRPLGLVIDIVAWSVGVWAVIFGASKVRNKNAINGHGPSGNTDFHA